MEAILAARPTRPMTSMPSASISPGPTRSPIARTPTTTPTMASMPAWRAAPMTSARRMPQVERSVAGSVDRCAAVSAMMSPAASVSM